jgi:hypothetical protein
MLLLLVLSLPFLPVAAAAGRIALLVLLLGLAAASSSQLPGGM